jgi:hypothetical protein
MKSKKINAETLTTFIEKLKLTLSYAKQELIGFQKKELEIKTKQDNELEELQTEKAFLLEKKALIDKLLLEQQTGEEK